MPVERLRHEVRMSDADTNESILEWLSLDRRDHDEALAVDSTPEQREQMVHAFLLATGFDMCGLFEVLRVFKADTCTIVGYAGDGRHIKYEFRAIPIEVRVTSC